MAYRTMQIILSDRKFEVLYQVAQNADRKPADQAQHIIVQAVRDAAAGGPSGRRAARGAAQSSPGYSGDAFAEVL